MPDEFVKDPNAVLDYLWDWSDWLKDDEEIVTMSFIKDPSTITIASTSNTAKNATAWLSSGVINTKYRITNRITTDQDRTEDRTITVRIKDR